MQNRQIALAMSSFKGNHQIYTCEIKGPTTSKIRSTSGLKSDLKSEQQSLKSGLKTQESDPQPPKSLKYDVKSFDIWAQTLQNRPKIPRICPEIHETRRFLKSGLIPLKYFKSLKSLKCVLKSLKS